MVDEPASSVHPSAELQTATAVGSLLRPLADRRLTSVVTIDDAIPLPAFSSLAEWQARRQELRLQLRAAAGLLPEPPRTPLNPCITARHQRDGYEIENIAFESMPGFFVTGNLYRPTGTAGPFPTLLCPHGHSAKGRLEHSPNNSTQARCISFARQGYIAFAYDMVGYNDAQQAPHRFDTWRDWLWSFGALHLQTWNSLRTVDYLLSRADVDPTRLGCVGESGGATQTLLLAALDDRVGFLAPVVMVSAHYQGGCICENIPNLRLATSNVEIAAMAAPRPMILVSASGDWTRNTPTIEFPAIQRIYSLYGAANNVSETQVDAPHNFNQQSREAVYRFFSSQFRGTPADHAIPEGPIVAEPEDVLRVFPNGLPPQALTLDGLRAAVRAQTANQLAAAWPTDKPTLEAFPVRFRDAYRFALDSSPSRPGNVTIYRLEDVSFGSHVGRRVLISRFPAERTTPAPKPEGVPGLFFSGTEGAPVVVVPGHGKASLFEERDGKAFPGEFLGALLDQQRAVLVVDPFQTGEYDAPAAFRGRDLSAPQFTTFNRTDNVLRVQDIVTAVAALRQLTTTDSVDVVGFGDAGIWAILARPCAEGVRRLAADVANFDWSDENVYMSRLYIPGLLKVGGVATALVLNAEAPTLLSRAPAEVSRQLASLYDSLHSSSSFLAEDPLTNLPTILAFLAGE